MSKCTDAAIIARAQNGGVDAVGELYDRHHRPVFRYIWARTSNKQLAEDLTGEVFMRMLDYLPKYEVRGVPFRAWLYRIAGNLVKDHYRRASQRTEVPLQQAKEVEVRIYLDSGVEKMLTLEKVKEALQTIDPAQREVILLRFIAGLSLKETAETLDKTVAAVKSLQHRGLVALRLALQLGG